MYILGGDQTIAMQVVANTPFEATHGKCIQRWRGSEWQQRGRGS